MILGTIIFNEKSKAWVNDREYNATFLRSQEQYLNAIIMNKGYLYLNEIYEKLCVKWDPEDENLCIIRNNPDQIVTIEFELFPRPTENTFLIALHYCD